MAEKIIKVISVGLQIDLLINKDTTVEEAIIAFCKNANIKPVCRHLFALRYDVNKWLPLHYKLWDLQEDVQKKVFEVRIRYRIPSIKMLIQTDINAFEYYFLQAREDILCSRIKEISYDKYKEELLGLTVTDMYRIILEKNIRTELILNDYKKYIPKEVFKHHLFFVKKPILDSLLRIEKTGIRDIVDVKRIYLDQFEVMAPSYLSEEFDGQIEEKGYLQSIELVVNIFNKEMPGIHFNYKGRREKHHLCSIEDICCISICENGTAEISRKNGIPVYMKMSSNSAMDSFVTLLDGYYRLSVKWIFNICKDFFTPSLIKLRRFKSHGPVGGQFSYSKLEQKRDNKPGCFILRECETSYDSYYIDVCLSTRKIATYKIEHRGEGHYWFSGDNNSYNSIPALISKFRTINSEIPMSEIIPPSEYDESQLLLCRLTHPTGLKSSVQNKTIDDINIGPQCINFKHLQVFSGKIYPGKRGITQVEKCLWRPYHSEQKLIVALKVLKSPCYDKYIKEFLDLLGKWCLLKSSAVVRLLGITLSSTIAMVTEFYPLGTLDVYLQTNKLDIQEVDLVEAAAYVATALWHMEGEGIVHGYLRCHKIFVVAHTQTAFTVRVADPGIHMLGERDLHWIPPELYDNYDEIKNRTTADVWAFGTILWQIFSYGEEPFVNGSVRDFYSSGKRLERPKDCAREMYRVMEECWHFDPDQRKRPQAAVRDIHQLLYQVHNSRRAHIYTAAKPNQKTKMNNSGGTLDSINTIEEDSTVLSLASQLTTSSYIDSEQDQFFKKPKQKTCTSEFNSFLPNLEFHRVSIVSLESTTSVQSIYEWSEHLDGEGRFGIKNVVLQGRIGQGCYGEVYKATAEDLNSPSDPQIYAVKKLITNRPSSCTADFQREIAIMKSLKHPNIVEMKGVIQDPEMLLIMEYVPQGSLKCHLCANKDKLTERHLFKYALDVANGMAYLGHKNIVHRDLAARNVLVASEYCVKISDFGLAQFMGSGDYYMLKTNRELPLGWYAPESIRDGKFSTLSDVWSYGVLLYEMFSFGTEPTICNSSTSDANALYNSLKSGIRLPRPDFCPNEVYANLMMRCWKFVEKERPSFLSIIEIVNQFITY